MPIVKPLKRNSAEGYPEDISINSDAIEHAGEYLQNGTSNDPNVNITRNPSDDLVFTDPNAGSVTLSDLVDNYDLRLNTEPNHFNNNYSNTIINNKITNETWINTITTNNVKTIDYTYTDNKVMIEVRKLYAPNGVTIVAQMTLNYVYTNNIVTSEIVTRNI